MEWLLNQINRLPDPNEIGNLAWALDALARTSDKLSIQWYVSFLEHARQPPHAWRLDLAQFVKVIEARPVSQEDRHAIEALLSHNLTRGPLPYHVPEYAKQIDPSGLLIPDMVVENLRTLKDEKDADRITRWSRFAGQYDDESDAWRKIAKAACAIGTGLDDDSRNDIYLSLERTGEVFSVEPGQLNPRWQEKLDRARKAFERETDPDLLPFRGWRVSRAEAELTWQREFQEERSTIHSSH